jgi:hypothetical protein
MSSKLVKILGLLVLVSLMLSANQSDASITLSLTDGTTTVTIGDNLPGDLNPTLGEIFWSGPVGAWNLDTEVGLVSPPALPSSTAYMEVDLNSSNRYGAGATPLTITLLADGPLPIVPAIPFQLVSTIGGTTSSDGPLGVLSLTATQTVRLADGPVFVTHNVGGQAFSDVKTTTGTLGGAPFQVLESVTITPEPNSTAGLTTFDFNSKVIIPEPISVVIWSLLGLSGAGLAMVRRRKINARSPWSDEARDAIRKIVNQ